MLAHNFTYIIITDKAKRKVFATGFSTEGTNYKLRNKITERNSVRSKKL